MWIQPNQRWSTARTSGRGHHGVLARECAQIMAHKGAVPRVDEGVPDRSPLPATYSGFMQPYSILLHGVNTSVERPMPRPCAAFVAPASSVVYCLTDSTEGCRRRS